MEISAYSINLQQGTILFVGTLLVMSIVPTMNRWPSLNLVSYIYCIQGCTVLYNKNLTNNNKYTYSGEILFYVLAPNVSLGRTSIFSGKGG